MSDRISVLVKFEPDALKRVEDFAEREGTNRMAAILELIRRGLLVELSHRKADEAVRRFAPIAAEKFFGKTALGEPIPERKPYQKGSKK